MSLLRCALALCVFVIGCDGAASGTDGGEVRLDGGDPGDDAGDPGDDAGDPDEDAGTEDGGSDGGEGDAGADAGDAGNDAGSCTPLECEPSECGVGLREDGCGAPLDCGPCATGGPCVSDAGCSGECIDEATAGWGGGYCSRECRTDLDCAVGAHCGGIDGLTRLGACLADCRTEADCRAEQACIDVDGSGDLECASVGTGTGAVGSPCTAHEDCGGGLDGFCAIEANGLRGGYCARTCSSSTPCPSGSHCGFTDAGGAGFCVQNCASDGACRADGYLCYNADGDAGNTEECYAAATGTGAPGTPCEGVWQCDGATDGICFSEDADFFEGFCGIRGCTDDGDCPLLSHCSAFDGVSVCLPDCRTNSDCRAGYVCDDANADSDLECFPGGTGSAAVGAPCEGVWECAGGARAVCIERPDSDFPDGYCALVGCTATGTGATGCPSGSHCTIATGSTTGVCVDTCGIDADCRAGYLCYDTGDMGTTTECLPAGTGTGAVGAPCRWLEDCAGEERAVCLLEGDPEDPADDQPGGYCIQLCNAVGCPSGSTCLGTSPTRVCFDACSGAGDCRGPDYTCQADGLGGNVCATP